MALTNQVADGADAIPEQSLRAPFQDALNNTNFHTPNIFGLWTAPDFNDSDHYTAYLLQGGVQLPDREYYLSDSEHMKKLREQYQAHIAAIMKLAGFPDTDAKAKGILELEHSIAEKQLSLAESEDIHKANNTWTPADFTAKAPGLDWSEYFRGAGLTRIALSVFWNRSPPIACAIAKRHGIDAYCKALPIK